MLWCTYIDFVGPTVSHHVGVPVSLAAFSIIECTNENAHLAIHFRLPNSLGK